MSFIKRFGFFTLLISLVTAVVFYYLGKPTIGIDDSNIFFTYAKHAANQEGFVYNTGGEKVEGFTSLLYTFICTVAYTLSTSPEMMLLLFLLLVTSITITMVYTALEKDIHTYGDPQLTKYLAPVYCLFILCISPGLVTWSVLSLMENAIWNFFFAAIVVLLLQASRNKVLSRTEQTGLILSAILLVMTRPEGIAWSIFFCIVLLLINRSNRQQQWLPFLTFLATITAFGLLTWFRQSYFGYPFPNTYYAKVSHDRVYNIIEGARYALGFVTGYNAVITLLLVALLVYSFQKRNTLFGKPALLTETIPPIQKQAITIGLVILVSLGFPLLTGGDHFGGFRFYQSILLLFAWGIPVLFVLIKQSTTHARNAGKTLVVVIALFLGLAGFSSFYNLKNFTKTQLDIEFRIAKEGRELATRLNESWPGAKPSVGIITVGGFGLVYQGETIDLMGLNNIRMGHSQGDRKGIKNHAAFNKDVFYTLGANLVLPKIVSSPEEALKEYMNLLATDDFNNKAMKNIFNDSLFKSNYQPVFMKQKNTNRFLFAFAHTTYIQRAGEEFEVILVHVPSSTN